MHLGPVSPANPHLQINRKSKHLTYYNILSILFSQKQVFLYVSKQWLQKHLETSLMHSKGQKNMEKLLSSVSNCILKVKKNTQIGDTNW